MCFYCRLVYFLCHDCIYNFIKYTTADFIFLCVFICIAVYIGGEFSKICMLHIGGIAIPLLRNFIVPCLFFKVE